jgi:DNA-binding protein HU-beta
MNKAELIERLAQKTGLSSKDARMAVEAIFDTDPGAGLIPDELNGGGKVTISGFGTFECRTRKQRQGRNPRTGETLTIPSSRAPVFKAGKPLKDRLRGHS